MLTACFIRSILEYNPESGQFIWKIRPRKRTPAGSVAGFIREGRLLIGIDGRAYRAHRLAFLWMNGVWPKNEVDHKDRNSLNNKWDNLREATRVQNLANRAVRKNSRTGVKGVYFDPRRKKYRASIGHGGKQIFLGHYDSLIAAQSVYTETAFKLNGEYAGS